MRFPAATLLGVAIFHCEFTLPAQGNLTPPGAPAPGFKTLDQVEPRTPININTAPGGFVSGVPAPFRFVISQPGSYYLTTNIFGEAAKHGIGIVTNNVTLDLKGFSVLGVASAGGGIRISSGCSNVVVRNGTISEWTGSYSGIECQGNNVTLEQLTICGNYLGLQCFDRSVVKACVINDNQLFGLVVAGSSSVITGNTLVGNNRSQAGNAGIFVVGDNNRIEGNHVSSANLPGYGIQVVSSPAFTNNLVIRNQVSGSGGNNYSFDANQVIGPLITNTVSGIITNLNPWANFSF